MNENTISYKLDRIKNSTDRMRAKTGVVTGAIEDVATAVEDMSVINNQDKEITENGSYSAEEGYTGLGTVNVNVEPLLGNKTITVNGTYNAVNDNLQGYATVNINVPTGGGTPVKSNIYRVSTIEERNAITDMIEGDMCVVHRPNTKNATVDTIFQTAIFPNTVVLDTAITDYINVMYRSVDASSRIECRGMLDSSSFRMDCYSESGSIEIQYTSEDGITYTRTDNTGNPVDFGAELYCPYAEEWNDAVGYFIQISSIDFEGIFEYKDGIWEYAKIGMDTTSDYIYKNKKAYTDNGVLEGNLGGIPSILFDDMNAELYGSTKAAYSNLHTVIKPTKEELALMRCFPVNNEGEPLVDLTDAINGADSFNFSDYGGLNKLVAIEDVILPSSVKHIYMYNSKLKYFNLSPKTGLTSITFSDNKELEYIGDLSFISFTSCLRIFSNTEKLKYLPNFIPVGDCEDMAYHSGIIGVNNLDFSKVKKASYMFNACKNLETVGELNLANVENIQSMFYKCEKLHTVGKITLPSYLYYGKSMFYGCSNLSDDSLNNILEGFTGFKTRDYGANKEIYITLKDIGLNDEQIERCHNLSNYSTFIAAGNTDK